MPHSELLADLAPLAALDALDGSEREEFAAHLLSCARCGEEVERWQSDLSRLAGGVSPLLPGVPSRARLRSAAAFDFAARARPRLPRPAVWLAVAASLALVVAATDDVVRRRAAASAARENVRLASENARDRRELAAREVRVRFLEDPDVRAIPLTGLGPQPAARGRVIYSPRARRALFVAADLAPIPSDRQYELWFLTSGKPVPAGTFDRTEGRSVVFESTVLPESIAEAEKFAVTIEPRGGVPQPTGPMILAGG